MNENENETVIELTETFGSTQETENPKGIEITSFEHGCDLIEKGVINGFECYASFSGEYHPFAALYRMRRWGDGWQFKLCHHGMEGSGIYESDWRNMLPHIFTVIRANAGASFKAI
jgi:hypothetical protein